MPVYLIPAETLVFDGLLVPELCRESSLAALSSEWKFEPCRLSLASSFSVYRLLISIPFLFDGAICLCWKLFVLSNSLGPDLCLLSYLKLGSMLSVRVSGKMCSTLSVFPNFLAFVFGVRSPLSDEYCLGVGLVNLHETHLKSFSATI